MELLKRCRSMQLEKSTLEAHLSSFQKENQELNNEIGIMRNELIESRKQLKDAKEGTKMIMKTSHYLHRHQNYYQNQNQIMKGCGHSRK